MPALQSQQVFINRETLKPDFYTFFVDNIPEVTIL